MRYFSWYGIGLKL